MIPHHQGAIAMAELALGQARRAEIRALAQRIISSQSQDIVQMRRWYQQWYGTPVPVLGVHGPGGMAMAGTAWAWVWLVYLSQVYLSQVRTWSP